MCVYLIFLRETKRKACQRIIWSSPSQSCRVIGSREAFQIYYLDQHASPDVTNGKLITGNQIIKSPAANGEHLCGLVSADQEFLILSERYAARTFAFGDVYFCHWRWTKAHLRAVELA
jgi:hypothetical protein